MPSPKDTKKIEESSSRQDADLDRNPTSAFVFSERLRALSFKDSISLLIERKEAYERSKEVLFERWPMVKGGKGKGNTGILSMIDAGKTAEEIVDVFKKKETPLTPEQLEAKLAELQAQLAAAKKGQSLFD